MCWSNPALAIELHSHSTQHIIGEGSADILAVEPEQSLCSFIFLSEAFFFFFTELVKLLEGETEMETYR